MHVEESTPDGARVWVHANGGTRQFYMPTQELDIQSESGHRIIDTRSRYRLRESRTHDRFTLLGRSMRLSATRRRGKTLSVFCLSKPLSETRASQTFDLSAVEDRKGSESINDQWSIVNNRRAFKCKERSICIYLYWFLESFIEIENENNYIRLFSFCILFCIFTDGKEQETIAVYVRGVENLTKYPEDRSLFEIAVFKFSLRTDIFLRASHSRHVPETVFSPLSRHKLAHTYDAFSHVRCLPTRGTSGKVLILCILPKDILRTLRLRNARFVQPIFERDFETRRRERERMRSINVCLSAPLAVNARNISRKTTNGILRLKMIKGKHKPTSSLAAKIA